MAYKMIALDLDGTILTREKNIPQKVKDTVSKASEKGVKVVISTGRTRKGAIRFYEELGLDTLLIASGGAEVFDSSGNAVFTSYPDPSLVKELLLFSRELGVHSQVYMNDELIFMERNKYADMYEKRYGYPALVIPNLIEKRVITPKVLFIADADKAPEIRKAVDKKFPMLATMRSDPMYIEILNPGVNKGAGLKTVAEYYGIDRSDIIAVGDSEIDLSMLEFAGLSVAVANAEPLVIEIADAVFPSNEDAGVADLIEKYILEA